ncbi:MAG: SDR family NAD(P)-dependent oxidoreductase, partial [Planctomycetes bacterium]|nr:SDR family NAD(P)-dependent oxidoreductase [Planctomycetota bacterium]
MAINSEVLELLSQEGKVAVITGAASGIGRASALRLAQAGAQVALLDINETAGPEAAEEVRQAGGAAKFYLCNVASDKDCRRAIEEIVQDYGRIDILFNNAG